MPSWKKSKIIPGLTTHYVPPAGKKDLIQDKASKSEGEKEVKDVDR